MVRLESLDAPESLSCFEDFFVAMASLVFRLLMVSAYEVVLFDQMTGVSQDPENQETTYLNLDLASKLLCVIVSEQNT